MMTDSPTPPRESPPPTPDVQGGSLLKTLIYTLLFLALVLYVVFLERTRSQLAFELGYSFEDVDFKDYLKHYEFPS